MIRPALLYKDELNKKNVESWYKPENMYYHSGPVEHCLELKDNNEVHQLVSIDKNNEVIGYISYCIDWAAMSAYNFGIISYDKGNLTFVKDLYQVIFDLFFKYNLNRFEWFCYDDNPAIKGYKKFIKRYGGRESGHLRQMTMLMDGKLHDSTMFEILRSDLKINKNEWRK